jgi:hypothetical protein
MNTTLILCIAIGCFVLLAVWLGLMEWRLKKIFRGKKARGLEDVLKSLGEDLKNLHVNQEKTEKYLKEVEERLKKSLKQVGMVRFNPFGESGSNQSFSIAFLDECGNGAVISTLYTRDNIKTYAKPIKEYESEHALTPEEEEAIRRTKGP